MIKIVETAIIGGGFSGLFFADGLAKKGDGSFILIEKRRNKLGGYAIFGGIKIGLLPAGNRTLKDLPPGLYQYYEKQFVKKYEKYLIAPHKKIKNIDFRLHGLTNKFYYSYILTKAKGLSLISKLQSDIRNKIIYSEVINIKKVSDNYVLYLKNDLIIKCRKLIIASGRNCSAIALMERIGQVYVRKHDLLLGCRVTFDSESAKDLFYYQPDFKIRGTNSYQTYCFNYRGDINSYEYNKNKIYSGSFNKNRISGNCFIGRREITTPEAVFKKFKKPLKISYDKLSKMKWPKSMDDFHGLYKFMGKIEKYLGLKFYDLYFPALEQFWPRPKIKPFSLESTTLPNVYFIGDASGISFGFLQCYITANALLKRGRKK